MSMHHRRKQRFSEETCGKCVIDGEETNSEPTINMGPGNRTDNEDSSIVISDTDDVELQEESILPKKRRRPPPLRKPLPVKRKIAHMTEEEQLALAVKMSQQMQTKHEEYTQEEEDELIKKAIEESLHSCQATEIPISGTKDEIRNVTHLSKEMLRVSDDEEEPSLSMNSRLSDEGSTKTPFVLLQRLSQDIVESSSIILSPNCKDPISCIENGLQSPLSPPTSSDFVKMSPAKQFPLSPVFPKKSTCSRRLIPCRLFQERNLSDDGPGDDLDDQLTHCSESPQIDSTLIPILCSQGEISHQNDGRNAENLWAGKAKKMDCKDVPSVDGTETSMCGSDKRMESGSTINYYWGVPFCPKGVNPSEYTKVILCQLEVYQKSLKSAQRQLLHKKHYGQPIHPEASSQENDKEGKSQEDDTAEKDTQKLEESEKEDDDNSDSQETEHISSKRQKTAQSPPQTTPDNGHCSSFQGDKDNSKALFTKLQPSECEGVAPVAPGESAVSPTAVRNDRHLMEHTETAQEEEITICPETQPSPAKQEESAKEDPADGMDFAPEPQACIPSESSDEDIICLDKMFHKNVACPMCGCNFPRTQIERHAAYCDGTIGQQEMAVLRPRNKLTRRSHDSSAVSMTSADTGKCEKCYICKSLVPLKDYQAHVDNCLQTAVLETQDSRLRNNKREYPAPNCRLLSMLEQSESSSLAEANSTTAEPSRLSPPREDYNDSLTSELLNLSDSPIKSFVSISEATDCLVDFKKQFSRQPNSRRASRRGKRRRM
ncbi:BRCA1-A complex subunit RAP80 isoform 2-T2 [Leptodactylus fuscus]